MPGALVPHRYVDQVEKCGGIAIVIPPRPDADDGTALEIVDRLDGVILAGGVDVAPELYADERDASSRLEARSATRPDRHRRATRGPTCRPRELPRHEVMAVAAGGLLEQHLPNRVGHDDTRPRRRRTATTRYVPSPGRGWPAYSVRRPTCRATTTVRPDPPGLRGSAWADDGTLEAMEDRDAFLRLAVESPRGRHRPAPLPGARRGGREPMSATVVTGSAPSRRPHPDVVFRRGFASRSVNV